MTVGLEMRGVEVLGPIIADAAPTHPSLIDEHHLMDALFGVTNIPQAFWIDEDGVIVRGPVAAVPPPVMRPGPDGDLQPYGLSGNFGAHHEPHLAELRDWIANGAHSEFAKAPDEVIADSHPRPMESSQAAAHFELAQHLHRGEGFSRRVLDHFGRAHTLEPQNITYKRQAYSAWRIAQGATGDFAMFDQIPHDDEDWPFVSDFDQDMALIGSPIRIGRSG